MTRWEIEKIEGKGPITILLIEDDKGYARLIEGMINELEGRPFKILHTETLEKGLNIVAEGGVDVILLDLLLPDSEGIFTFLKLNEEAKDVPIVVLSALEDDETALLAVKEGAQDYLFKGVISPKVLVRTIRHSVERKRTSDLLLKTQELLASTVERQMSEINSLRDKLKKAEEERDKLIEKLKEK